MQCDTKCSTYSPCISSCPRETCENFLQLKSSSQMCSQEVCVEGLLRFLSFNFTNHNKFYGQVVYWTNALRVRFTMQWVIWSAFPSAPANIRACRKETSPTMRVTWCHRTPATHGINAQPRCEFNQSLYLVHTIYMHYWALISLRDTQILFFLRALFDYLKYSDKTDLSVSFLLNFFYYTRFFRKQLHINIFCYFKYK